MAKANASNANVNAAAGEGNANSETIVNTTVTKAAPVLLANTSAARKSDKAREIFNQCYANFHTDPKSVPQRKDIIQRFVTEAGLTPAGAATYLQNMKKKAGLVASK